MITYDPFWETLKPKGITQYKLLNDYNFSHGTYYHIRELSDTLCKDHNLSVINPSQNKGKNISPSVLWTGKDLFVVVSVHWELITQENESASVSRKRTNSRQRNLNCRKPINLLKRKLLI